MTDRQHDTVIRRAEPHDVPALVACSSALFEEDAGSRDPSVNVDWPREHGHQRFAAGIDDPARLLLVADREGEVVGHLSGVLETPSAMKRATVATLVSMYVQPPHRRTGTGRHLVAEFLLWARSTGADRAVVTAYASNTDAIRFYERNAFAPQAVTLETVL